MASFHFRCPLAAVIAYLLAIRLHVCRPNHIKPGTTVCRLFKFFFRPGIVTATRLPVRHCTYRNIFSCKYEKRHEKLFGQKIRKKRWQSLISCGCRVKKMGVFHVYPKHKLSIVYKNTQNKMLNVTLALTLPLTLTLVHKYLLISMWK